MPLVAKRKLRQTWREVVALRGGAEADILLSRFDALRSRGLGEGEAAYRVLEAAGMLWVADEPGAARPTLAEPEEVPHV